MNGYNCNSIDMFNPNTNTFHKNVAVWDNSEKCAYHDWYVQILANGEYETPDGCIYSIHEEEGET